MNKNWVIYTVGSARSDFGREDPPESVWDGKDPPPIAR